LFIKNDFNAEVVQAFIECRNENFQVMWNNNVGISTVVGNFESWSGPRRTLGKVIMELPVFTGSKQQDGALSCIIFQATNQGIENYLR